MVQQIYARVRRISGRFGAKEIDDARTGRALLVGVVVQIDSLNHTAQLQHLIVGKAAVFDRLQLVEDVVDNVRYRVSGSRIDVALADRTLITLVRIVDKTLLAEQMVTNGHHRFVQHQQAVRTAEILDQMLLERFVRSRLHRRRFNHRRLHGRHINC